jgi:hypothetical protein
MSYTTEEKVIMIKWFYAGNSLSNVSNMFSVYFPDRPIPTKSGIQKVITKFEAKGTVINNCKCTAQNDERVEENYNKDLNILLQVEENKNISTRSLGQSVEKHHTTVLRTLKKHKYHSYKYQNHQELLEGDEERRSLFCFEMMERANNDRYFLQNICFTDECTFTLNNEPNIQNYRYWSTQNEHRLACTRTQYPQKVNVWAGIFGHRIIGPFFIDGNLTGPTYLNLLQNQIGPALEEVVDENQDIWFQMDGCPAHNSLVVREYLNNAFNGHVIGPNSTILWPARSPDLSPNDFFLWGHLKNVLYTNVKFENLEQLKNLILMRSERITQYQLANVRREFYDRLGYCLAADGGLFEHLIKN